MANSRYDYLKQHEKLTDLRFNQDTYIIVRIDGDKFHRFSAEHNFHKPNDKRALDLMVASAKNLMHVYKGHISLAFGHSDEFSFLIKNTSSILSRRVFKLTSMLPVVFATYYNSNWTDFFSDPTRGKVTPRKYDAWFDARPKEYASFRSVINYFKWRQVDCHINNLYNTALHALTGRYVRHELIPCDQSTPGATFYDDGSSKNRSFHLKLTPITDWEPNQAKFLSPQDATAKLSGTQSSTKHDIMYLEYKINYNNELEQFKKGTVIVDTQKDYDGKNADTESIKAFNLDLTKSEDFWRTHSHIFSDYVDLDKLEIDHAKNLEPE